MSRILAALAAVMLLAGPVSGATIAVHVARNGDRSPLDVRLGLARDEREPDWLAVRHLTPGRADVTFRDLGAGHYALLLEGPRPLQRVSAHAVVAANDDRTLTIGIHPRPFHGRFTLGGTPLTNATVTLHAADFSTSVTTNARGLIDEPLWQSGDVDLAIDSPRLGAPYLAQARIAGRLAVDIESRVVRGVVRGTNGEPVAGAAVTLRSEGETQHVPRRTRTGDDGEFRIDGVSAGSHSLRVTASGYLRLKPIELEITSGERVENVILDTGTRLPVEVVDADGKPVPGATLVCATGSAIHSTTRSDVLGRALVATPPGVDATLFVLPLEGGIVAQPVASARRISIPAGNASLQVDALADDAPLTGISLLVRYNGTIIPPEVARILGAQQQASFVTDAQGRVVLPRVAPGAYELWAYRSDEEAEALMASQSALAAPISLEVAPGENRITVRFKARH
jgi:Carboxypeptidase regulatory-like domain